MKKIVFFIVISTTMVVGFAQEKAVEPNSELEKTDNSSTSCWFWGIGAIIVILAVLSFLQKAWKKK